VDFLETESAVIFKTLRTDLSRLDANAAEAFDGVVP
jgi:hypothetical protein